MTFNHGLFIGLFLGVWLGIFIVAVKIVAEEEQGRWYDI